MVQWSRMMLSVFSFFSILFIASCGGDDDEPVKPGPSSATAVTVDATVAYQEMVGFGGALTWYSDRMLSSNKKEEIADLLFTDLGTDIIRFKNWYYPDNYPTVKSTDVMSDDNSKLLWNTTNTLYDMSQDRNPDIEVLLSSWGPPPSLKSNNNTREGTLKKDNGKYMYRAFGKYWKDLLDNLPFDPEYASIQNEPTFVTSSWTTCQWAALETLDLPGYDRALDSVYEEIKAIPNAPMLIGPESANIGDGAAGNTFTTFAERLKNNDHVGMYAYHPYNFSSGTSSSEITSKLSLVKGYSGKPNIMTEYSDVLSWHATAKFINSTVIQGNTSGYIYWKMVWATPGSGVADHALVSIADNGTYTVTPYYYVMKHFAKFIDKGYKRIKISSSNSDLSMTAFINPEEDQMTVIIVNTGGVVKIKAEATGKTITNTLAIQSTEGNFYKELDDISGGIVLPSESVTTLVLDL